jgi:hypothetical protein
MQGWVNPGLLNRFTLYPMTEGGLNPKKASITPGKKKGHSAPFIRNLS